MIRAPFLLLLLLLPLLLPLPGLAGPAHAVQPDEMLEDPALEARARELSTEIRCLVCQNESIDTSNADIARDLRVLIRERLKAGDSEAEIKSYLVDRYGDFVLMKPPVKPETWLLWFGPAIVVLIGGAAVALYLRRRARPGSTEGLSEEERRRIDALLKDDGGR